LIALVHLLPVTRALSKENGIIKNIFAANPFYLIVKTRTQKIEANTILLHDNRAIEFSPHLSALSSIAESELAIELIQDGTMG
jgi:hypothetical protein